MDEALFVAQRYFAAPRDHWWRWDREGLFLEFSSGKSIAPKQQVVNLVTSLADNGLPPMDLLVLFILATHDKVEEHFAELKHYDSLLDTLNEMRNLGLFDPDELTKKQSAAADYLFSKLGQRCSRKTAMEIVERICDVDFSSLVSDDLRRDLNQSLVEKLHTLNKVDAGQVELYEATGYEKLPDGDALDLDFPGNVRRLLEDMKDDPHWSALERLTQQALAAISLPKRLSEKQDLPDGGYQDISNRGDLDRILPGELAHEDEMLLLRLSQGEALFLERERPPHQPSQREWLILDNGLRMWGEPKMIGLATALALSVQQETNQHLELLRPCGEGLEPVSLLTRDDLLDYLNSTENHLECTNSCSKFIEDNPKDTVMVLTEKRCLHELLKQKSLLDRKAPLYLFLVDHKGYLSLEQWSRSGLKNIREACLDLEVFVPNVSEHRSPDELYPIYSIKPCPIRLPFDTEKMLCLPLNSKNILSSSDRVLLAEWCRDSAYPRIIHLRPELQVPIGMGLNSRDDIWVVLVSKDHGQCDWMYLEMDPANGEVLTKQRLERSHAQSNDTYCGFIDNQLVIIQSGQATSYEPYSGVKTSEFMSGADEHICQHFYFTPYKKQWSELSWNRGLILEPLSEIPDDTLALVDNKYGRFRLSRSFDVFRQHENKWEFKFSGSNVCNQSNEKLYAVGPCGLTVQAGEYSGHFESGIWQLSNRPTGYSGMEILTSKRLGLRRQILGIYLSGTRFGILNRKGNLQEFEFSERCELVQGVKPDPKGCYWFSEAPLSEQKQVTFQNGSQIIMDGNHVLHLLPAKPDCPSLSLIVVQQFFVGCSETGESFGHDPFLLKRASLRNNQVQKLFQAVLEGLQC